MHTPPRAAASEAHCMPSACSHCVLVAMPGQHNPTRGVGATMRKLPQPPRNQSAAPSACPKACCCQARITLKSYNPSAGTQGEEHGGCRRIVPARVQRPGGAPALLSRKHTASGHYGAWPARLLSGRKRCQHAVGRLWQQRWRRRVAGALLLPLPPLLRRGTGCWRRLVQLLLLSFAGAQSCSTHQTKPAVLSTGVSPMRSVHHSPN